MWKAADCNHDGVINEADVDLLMGAGLRKNDIAQNVAQAELETQATYIEYVSLIDQSAYLNSDFTPDTDNSEQVTNPETNETIKLDALVEETDVEAIFTNIFEFIKKILSFVFMFIV